MAETSVLDPATASVDEFFATRTITSPADLPRGVAGPPPPEDAVRYGKGKRTKNETTGENYLSDGTHWIPQGTDAGLAALAQGPAPVSAPTDVATSSVDAFFAWKAAEAAQPPVEERTPPKDETPPIPTARAEGTAVGTGGGILTVDEGPATKPPIDEAAFQAWYKQKAVIPFGMHPNPDNPRHFYDWRGAYQAGAGADASGHWPSQFKRDGHPNLVVEGVDTRTGKPVAPSPALPSSTGAPLLEGMPPKEPSPPAPVGPPESLKAPTGDLPVKVPRPPGAAELFLRDPMGAIGQAGAETIQRVVIDPFVEAATRLHRALQGGATPEQLAADPQSVGDALLISGWGVRAPKMLAGGSGLPAAVDEILGQAAKSGRLASPEIQAHMRQAFAGFSDEQLHALVRSQRPGIMDAAQALLDERAAGPAPPSRRPTPEGGPSEPGPVSPPAPAPPRAPTGPETAPTGSPGPVQATPGPVAGPVAPAVPPGLTPQAPAPTFQAQVTELRTGQRAALLYPPGVPAPGAAALAGSTFRQVATPQGTVVYDVHEAARALGVPAIPGTRLDAAVRREVAAGPGSPLFGPTPAGPTTDMTAGQPTPTPPEAPTPTLPAPSAAVPAPSDTAVTPPSAEVPAPGVRGPAPAEFLGWQENANGKPPFPLYNVTEDVPGTDLVKGSTVDPTHLARWGFTVPEPTTPMPVKAEATQQDTAPPADVARETKPDAAVVPPGPVGSMPGLQAQLAEVQRRFASWADQRAQAIERIRTSDPQAAEAARVTLGRVDVEIAGLNQRERDLTRIMRRQAALDAVTTPTPAPQAPATPVPSPSSVVEAAQKPTPPEPAPSPRFVATVKGKAPGRYLVETQGTPPGVTYVGRRIVKAPAGVLDEPTGLSVEATARPIAAADLVTRTAVPTPRRALPPRQVVPPAAPPVPPPGGRSGGLRRPLPALSADVRAQLQGMKDEISQGQPGRRIFQRDEDRYLTGVVGQPSTYPAYMTKIAPTAKEATKAIDQALAGQGTAAAHRAVDQAADLARQFAEEQATARPRPGDNVSTPRGEGTVRAADADMVVVALDNDGNQAFPPGEVTSAPPVTFVPPEPPKPLHEMTKPEYDAWVQSLDRGTVAERKGRYRAIDGPGQLRLPLMYAQRPGPDAKPLAQAALGDVERGSRDLPDQPSVLRPAAGVGRAARPERGVPSGAGARTLGLGITALVRTGRVDLRGAVVRSPRDLAQLAQIYRDPRFETFRIFYVRAGTVVAHEGLSSRLPNASAAFLRSPVRDFQLMRERMRRLGADGYYLLHNHPSGATTPSTSDAILTRKFAQQVPGFQAHVIIDHEVYSHLDATGHETGGVIPPPVAPDAVLRPSVSHPLLGRVLTNPMELATLGRDLQAQTGYVTVLYRTGNTGLVRAIQEVPLGTFRDPTTATDYLRGRAREFGGADVFAVLASPPDRALEGTLRTLIHDGILTDALEVGRPSLRDMGVMANSTALVGAFGRSFRASRVNEPVVPYEDPHKAAVRAALRSGVLTPARAQALGHFAAYPDLAAEFAPRVDRGTLEPVTPERGPGSSSPTPPSPPEPAGGMRLPNSRQISAYEAGREYAGASLLHAWERELRGGPGRVNPEHEVASAFFEAGVLEHPMPRWVSGWRYGEIPEWGYSWNHRENAAEPGVSLQQVDGGPPLSNQTFALFNPDLPRVHVEGWLLARHGADGEPLIVGARRLAGGPSPERPAGSAAPGEEVRVDRTPGGEQVRIPGTSRREIPAGPIRKTPTEPPLESVQSEANLFNADRKAEQARVEASQGDLLAPSGAQGLEPETQGARGAITRPPDVANMQHRAQQLAQQGVTGTIEPDLREQISRHAIQRAMNRLHQKLASLGGPLPEQVGGLRGARQGEFKVKAETIRTKVSHAIEVFAHELGHHLDKQVFRRATTSTVQAFAQELHPLATKGKQSEEGLAEFVRLYLTDPATAQARAPKFFPAFEALLGTQRPDLLGALQDIQRRYSQWVALPVEARIDAHVVRDAGARQLPSRQATVEFAHRLYAYIVNEQDPFSRMVANWVRQTGTILAADRDPVILGATMRAVSKKGDAFITEGVLDYTTLDIVPGSQSLEQVLAPIATEWEAWEDYAIARRTQELLDRTDRGGHRAGELMLESTGLTREALDGYVAQRDATSPHFRAALDAYQTWNQGLLTYLKDAQVLSPEGYDAIVRLNQAHVSFQRLMESEARAGAATGQTVGNVPQGVHAIRGSGRPIISPIASAIKMAYLITNLAERATVGRALIDLAKALEGGGRWAEKRPVAMTPTSFTLGEIAKTLEAHGIDVPPDVQDELATIFRPDRQAKGESSLTIWRNGERETWDVDPFLHTAMLGLDGRLLKPLETFIRYTIGWFTTAKRLAVVLSPEFMARNTIKDQTTLMAQTGHAPFVGFIRSFLEAARQGPLYKEWERAGGAQANIASLDFPGLQKRRAAVLKGQTRLGRTLTHPWEILKILSALSEEPTRIDVYRSRMAAPLPEDVNARARKLRAAHESRESTLDFQRKGSITGALRLSTAFLGPSIQGPDKMVRTLRDHPGRALLAGAIIMTASLLFRLAIELWDTEPYTEPDGQTSTAKQIYDRLPQWQRDTFSIVITRGANNAPHVWRLMKGFDWGWLFGTLFERTVLDPIFQKHPAVASALGESAGRSIGFNVIPDALLPVLENAMNWSMYRDRPIVSQGLGDLLPAYQYTEYTSDTAKRLGRLRNYPPVKIDHLLEIGNLARSGIQAADALQRAVAGHPRPEPPTPTAADRIGVRAFAVRYPASDAVPVQQVYDFYAKAHAAASTLAAVGVTKSQTPSKMPPRLGTEDQPAIVQDIAQAHTVELILEPVVTKLIHQFALRERLKTMVRQDALPDDAKQSLAQSGFSGTLTPDDKRAIIDRLTMVTIREAEVFMQAVDDVRARLAGATPLALPKASGE